MPARRADERHLGHEEHHRVPRRRSAFYSPDNRYDELFICNYLDLYVRDALRRVPGVGNVIIFGERKFAMRLWLDPEQAGGARPDGVRRRRRAARAERAGGRRQRRRRAVRRQPDVPAQRARRRPPGTRSPSSRTSSSKPASDGALVRVSDIGRVELGAESYSSRLRFAGVAGVRHRHHAPADRQRARHVPRRAGGARAAREDFPPGSRRTSPSTTSASSASRSSRC